MVCQGQGHGGKDKASVATADVNWTQTWLRSGPVWKSPSTQPDLQTERMEMRN